MLEINYWANKFFILGVFSLLLAVFAATPLQMYPARDALEDLIFDSKEEITPTKNFYLTLSMVTGCFILACLLPSINDALTLIGGTTNPMVGFIIPILIYLKMKPTPWKTRGVRDGWGTVYCIIIVLFW